MLGRCIGRILPVVQTAWISNSGSAFRAGIWAIEANPRSGLTPTIPTRILLFVAMNASLMSGACSYRCTSLIMIPSGPRMKRAVSQDCESTDQ